MLGLLEVLCFDVWVDFEGVSRDFEGVSRCTDIPPQDEATAGNAFLILGLLGLLLLLLLVPPFLSFLFCCSFVFIHTYYIYMHVVRVIRVSMYVCLLYVYKLCIYQKE